MKAPIREIFCSAQGEGPYVGVRQAFVRFEGCNLECVYCDTPQGPIGKCRVEVRTGGGEFMELENPLGLEAVRCCIRGYKQVHSVSLTGGEPLLYADFIKALKPGPDIYLETNMALPEGARKVAGDVRYVAGDLKVRESFPERAKYDDYLEAMVECFKVLRKTGERDCFGKIVLLRGVDQEEVVGVVEQIREYISCLVLQPVTPHGVVSWGPRVGEVLSLQERLLEKGVEARVIPQAHKLWGAM